MGLKELLEARGAIVVGPVATCADAHRLLSESIPDVALVDINLRRGELSYDLIERLHRNHLLTSVLATHNPVLAKRCSRVLRLEHGVLRPDAAYQPGPLPVTKGEKS